MPGYRHLFGRLFAAFHRIRNVDRLAYPGRQGTPVSSLDESFARQKVEIPPDRRYVDIELDSEPACLGISGLFDDPPDFLSSLRAYHRASDSSSAQVMNAGSTPRVRSLPC